VGDVMTEDELKKQERLVKQNVALENNVQRLEGRETTLTNQLNQALGKVDICGEIIELLLNKLRCYD